MLKASTSEELSIVENEELEVIEKDGEGWCKVGYSIVTCSS